MNFQNDSNLYGVVDAKAICEFEDVVARAKVIPPNASLVYNSVPCGGPDRFSGTSLVNKGQPRVNIKMYAFWGLKFEKQSKFSGRSPACCSSRIKKNGPAYDQWGVFAG